VTKSQGHLVWGSFSAPGNQVSFHLAGLGASTLHMSVHSCEGLPTP